MSWRELASTSSLDLGYHCSGDGGHRSGVQASHSLPRHGIPSSDSKKGRVQRAQRTPPHAQHSSPCPPNPPQHGDGVRSGCACAIIGWISARLKSMLAPSRPSPSRLTSAQSSSPAQYTSLGGSASCASSTCIVIVCSITSWFSGVSDAWPRPTGSSWKVTLRFLPRPRRLRPPLEPLMVVSNSSTGSCVSTPARAVGRSIACPLRSAAATTVLEMSSSSRSSSVTCTGRTRSSSHSCRNSAHNARLTKSAGTLPSPAKCRSASLAAMSSL